MKLEQGTRYRAQIRLGLFERFASNETIADKLRDAGFVDVIVAGDGRERTAVGRWAGATTSVDLPSQIMSVVQLA